MKRAELLVLKFETETEVSQIGNIIRRYHCELGSNAIEKLERLKSRLQKQLIAINNDLKMGQNVKELLTQDEAFQIEPDE